MDNITVHTDASISYPKMENSLVLVQKDTNSELTNDHVKMLMNVSGKYQRHLVLEQRQLVRVYNLPFSPSLNTCAKKGMECKNVIGYHQCHCGKGKTRDPRTDTCIGKLFKQRHHQKKLYFLDVNECEEENTCKNGRCQNTDGGFWCKCDAGFNPNEDMTECIGK